MTVRQALRQALERLTAEQVPSASTQAEVLLLHVLGRDRAFLYSHPADALTLEQESAYQRLVGQRAAGTPTQYLTRRQEFWGLALGVEPGVFIPRPETEHVVEVALAIARERLRRPAARLVDVGTGTGCIALALAGELPQAEIAATDISEDAVRVAQRNALALGLAARVRFHQCDLLEALLGEPGFDLIVSNPPYVAPEEAGQLPPEVREHEPPAALFSADEGVGVTRRLLEQAAAALVAGGWVVLELGYGRLERVRGLLGATWTDVSVTDDLRGIPRVLAARKP